MLEIQSSLFSLLLGGGNGSKILNDKIKENLEFLSERYLIVHQVGKQFFEEYSKLRSESYLPIAFVSGGMIDLFAEIVISRAGAELSVNFCLSINDRYLFLLKLHKK